jgi:heat shock protein HtpX
MAGLIAVLADWFLRISFYSGGDREERKGGPIVLVVALVAAILAPLAATLIRLAVSRNREFLADASGVLMTRYPDGLASALEKIGQDQSPMRKAHNATAHLFIANPFKGKEASNWLVHLFSTHPPIQERVKRLRGL